MSEPEVKGISKADFQAWRHHPVSKVFLQFLGDKSDFLRDHAVNMWLDGGLTLQADEGLRGQIIELFETRNMEFEALVRFYTRDEE